MYVWLLSLIVILSARKTGKRVSDATVEQGINRMESHISQFSFIYNRMFSGIMLSILYLSAIMILSPVNGSIRPLPVSKIALEDAVLSFF